MPTINTQYKDSFFKFIFGSNERKEYTLALYNALNGTHYDNLNDLTINTLEDVFYIDMKNDVSFIFDSHLVLYEHQSTINPNMSTRMLLYSAKLIDKLIEKKKINLYSHRKQHIPAPKFVVFYNGSEEMDEMITYKLSDLFENGYNGDIEIEVICYNINGTHNKKLKGSCKVLDEYAEINNDIRLKEREGMSLLEAVEDTLDNIPNTYILKEAIEENRGAIMGYWEKELSIDEYLKLEQKDWYLDGQDDAKMEAAKNMINDGISNEKVQKYTGLSNSVIEKLRKELKL